MVNSKCELDPTGFHDYYITVVGENQEIIDSDFDETISSDSDEEMEASDSDLSIHEYNPQLNALIPTMINEWYESDEVDGANDEIEILEVSSFLHFFIMLILSL